MILSLSGRINRFIAILFLVVVPFTQTARPTRRPHIPGEVPQWTVPRPVQSPRIVPLDGIRPDRHTYIDTLGRERYFRGLNVVMKGAPWHPRIDAYDSWDSFSKEDVEYLAYLNINLIRLGVMWPGVEPQRGVYNITYLGVMAKIVEMCREKVCKYVRPFRMTKNQ